MSNDPHNPVVLTTVTSDIEAAAIVTALDAHGIKATTTGGYTAGFRAEAPGVISVVVRHADLERARGILANVASDDESGIDWTNVDVGEPEES
jgi:hypothetical protein